MDEETLKKNCDFLTNIIESLIISMIIEISREDDKVLHSKAVKNRKKAHKLITNLLVDIVKSASDPTFVPKDINLITNEFKFVDFKD